MTAAIIMRNVGVAATSHIAVQRKKPSPQPPPTGSLSGTYRDVGTIHLTLLADLAVSK